MATSDELLNAIQSCEQELETTATVLRNSAEQIGNAVHKSGNETIAGTKTFSASPVIPTPAAGDNTTKAASTAFVTNALASKAGTAVATTSTNGLMSAADKEKLNTGVMTISGDQVVYGKKIFYNMIDICGYDDIYNHIGGIRTRSLDFDITDVSYHQCTFFNWCDINNNSLTFIRSNCTNNGMGSIFMHVNKVVDGTIEYGPARAQLHYDSDSKPEFTTQNIRPTSGNLYDLGSAAVYWKDIYNGSATPIAHSDARLKTAITAIPDAVLDAWGEVQWQQYQMIDAVEKKGSDAARIHTGAIAQRIDAVFKAHGLDASRYGLFCHDSWDAEDWDEKIVDKEAVTDEQGNVIEPEVSHTEHHHRDAGDMYALRYGECLCLEAAYQRRRADRMEAQLQAQAADIAAIKAKLGA